METTHNVVLIPLEEIDSNPFQPRRSMVDDDFNDLRTGIAMHGLLEPICVRAIKNRYQAIFGHRRIMAFRMLRDEATDEATRARFARIPACVRESVQDSEMLQLALNENIQRHALTPLEIGDGFVNLKKLNPSLGSVRLLAKASGQSVGMVGRHVTLAEAPPCIREALEDSSRRQDGPRIVPPLRVAPALELIRCYKQLKDMPGPVNPVEFAENRVRAMVRTARDQKWTTKRVRRYVDRVLEGKPVQDRQKASPAESRIDRGRSGDSVAVAVKHWWGELFDSAGFPYRIIIWFAGVVIQLFGTISSLIRSIRTKWRTWRGSRVQPAKVNDLPVSPPGDTTGHSQKAA